MTNARGYDYDAERAVIGAALLGDPHALHVIKVALRHFSPRYALIAALTPVAVRDAEALGDTHMSLVCLDKRLRSDGAPVDPAMLVEALDDASAPGAVMMFGCRILFAKRGMAP